MIDYISKNLDVIKKYHPEIIINQDIVDSNKKKDHIEILDSYNGYSLKSQVDQNLAISVWCEQFDELKHNEVAFVFGIGSLDYYVQLLDKNKELSVVIYEPCEEILYNCISCDDYSKLLEEDNLFFCIGENIYDSFINVLDNLMGYSSIQKPYFALIPNYNKIFEEEYDKFKKEVKDQIIDSLMSRNTAVIFEEERLNHYLDHLTKITDESSVTELIAKIKEIDIRNYPAIILSAGPSLDNNINKIKDIKGRAFVVAVDAAVNTASKNNIRPDIIVSTDSFMYEDTLRDEMGRELPLIIHMYGSIPIRELNKGRHFYITDFDYYLEKVLEQCGKRMTLLETGGSVANDAFSLCRLLGFSTIILMGQDLGFPGNKQHAIDAFDDEEDASEDDDFRYYVKSIDGGEVLTSIQMDNYRKWFEKKIQLHPDINVVDATEGGALIEGTEILTIDEAIEKYCPNERIDFEGLINDADYLLNDDNRDKIKGIINKTFDDIDYNIDYFNKVKRDYYKLRDINEKRKYKSAEFKQIIEKVGEHNKYIEDNKDFILYKKCCTQKYFECVDALKIVYDNEYDEIKNLVKQSLIMLDEYIKAGKKLKKKWNKLTDGQGIK